MLAEPVPTAPDTMIAAPLVRAPSDAVRGRLPVALLSAAGAAAVVAGGLLPWLSFFAGLQPVRGVDGAFGTALLGLGLVGLGAAAVHLVRGGTGTRWFIGSLGLVIVAIAGMLGIEALRAFSVLSQDPLVVARLELGLPVALLGGGLLASTMFLPSEAGVSTTRGSEVAPGHVLLAALLLVAGVIHIALSPEHLDGAVVLGSGFLVVGIVQVVLAPLLLIAPSRTLLSASLVVSVGSAVALLAAVTVGLPFLAHGETMGPLGPVEALDDLASATGVAEVVSAILAMRVLRSGGDRPKPQGAGT